MKKINFWIILLFPLSYANFNRSCNSDVDFSFSCFDNIMKQEEEKDFSFSCFEENKDINKLVDCIHLNDPYGLKLLLKRSNPELLTTKDEFGYTLTDYAIMHKNREVLKVLTNHPNQIDFPIEENIIHDLILSSQKRQSKKYSQAKLNKLLYVAAAANNSPLSELLCEVGANPYQKTLFGQSALDIATQYNFTSVIETFNRLQN